MLAVHTRGKAASSQVDRYIRGENVITAVNVRGSDREEWPRKKTLMRRF